MSRGHLIAAAAALAVLAAGCGSSSSGPSLSAFKSGFATEKATFRQLGTDLVTEITAAPHKSNAQIATDFSALSTRATVQAAALRGLKPPSKYKPQLNTLATDFDTVSADLKAISGSATSGDVSGARSQTTTLGQDSAKLKSVDVALSTALGLPAS